MQGPARRADVKLVRYADDCVALAKQMGTETIEFIESRLEGKFQLEINRDKTRVVDLREEGASLNFLGYTFRYDRDLKGRDRKYLNAFPSNKAVQREREKLREMTNRHQCHKPIPVLIGELNRHLKGWANYFSMGVLHRRVLGDRLVRARSPDPTSTAAQSKALSSAEGGVVVPAPSTFGAGPFIGACACLRREFSGEPDAGNPHLRFDEGRVRRSHWLSLTLLLYRLGVQALAQA